MIPACMVCMKTPYGANAAHDTHCQSSHQITWYDRPSVEQALLPHHAPLPRLAGGPFATAPKLALLPPLPCCHTSFEATLHLNPISPYLLLSSLLPLFYGCSCSLANHDPTPHHPSAPSATKPLERLKWIAYIAAFYNKEYAANAVYNTVRASYLALRRDVLLTAAPQTPLVCWVYKDWDGDFAMSFAQYKVEYIRVSAPVAMLFSSVCKVSMG